MNASVKIISSISLLTLTATSLVIPFVPLKRQLKATDLAFVLVPGRRGLEQVLVPFVKTASILPLHLPPAFAGIKKKVGKRPNDCHLPLVHGFVGLSAAPIIIAVASWVDAALVLRAVAALASYQIAAILPAGVAHVGIVAQ